MQPAQTIDQVNCSHGQERGRGQELRHRPQFVWWRIEDGQEQDQSAYDGDNDTDKKAN